MPAPGLDVGGSPDVVGTRYDCRHPDAEDKPAGKLPSDSAVRSVAPHPDDFSSLSIGDFKEDEEQGNAVQLRKVSFRLRSLGVRFFVAEIGTVVGLTTLMSLFSFGFVAFYFCFVVRPSAADAAFDGYSGWTSCYTASTEECAVTVLGHTLSLRKARALVSLPKMFAAAAMLSASGFLWRARLGVAPCVLTFVLFAIASGAVLFYTLAPFFECTDMPAFVDPAFGLSMFTIHAVVMSTAVRPRQSSGGRAARCPKMLFCLALFLLFGLKTVLTHAMTFLVNKNASPGIVVLVGIVLMRGNSFIARTILKKLSTPLFYCLMLLFAYDASMVVALKRYWLALPGMGEVAISAVVNAVFELACNAASAGYAVYGYNAHIEGGKVEKASVHINLFFTAIISELVAEHVALHGCLGYNLFLDTRLLTVNVQADASQAIAAWGVSLIVELIVDSITLVPMILFLPVSFRALFGKYSRSWVAISFMVVSCCFAHLVGLHAYLDRDRYFCV